MVVEEDFESNATVSHFLGNGVSPEGITILLVKFKGFFDCLWHLDAKFMGPFKVSRVVLLHKQNDTVSFLEDIRNSPVKCGFMVNAKNLSIFGSFNGMRFSRVDKILPRGRAILPLAAELSTTDNFLVSKLNSHGKTSVVNNLCQQHILVSIGVTLGIEGLCNHVCRKFGLVAIIVQRSSTQWRTRRRSI